MSSAAKMPFIRKVAIGLGVVVFTTFGTLALFGDYIRSLFATSTECFPYSDPEYRARMEQREADAAKYGHLSLADFAEGGKYGSGGDAVPEPRPPAGPERITREAQAELVAAIVARLAEATAAPNEAPAAAVGSLPKEYIKERIGELVPLVKECYDLAREENPELEGTIKVQFTVIGDPELGSVVEDSVILDDSSAGHDAVLSECVQETMYGLKMKAPEGGGRLTVTYPFIFRQAEEDG